MADEPRPTRIASTVAVVAALVAVALAGLYSWSALGVGTGGVLLFIGGLRGPRRSALTVGAGAIFVGVVFAGLSGAHELLLLLAGTATIVAWDSACTAVGLGAHLGRDTPTATLEVTHVTATSLVGIVTLAGAYGTYTLAGTEGPGVAILLFALAVVLIASALR